MPVAVISSCCCFQVLTLQIVGASHCCTAKRGWQPTQSGLMAVLNICLRLLFLSVQVFPILLLHFHCDWQSSLVSTEHGSAEMPLQFSFPLLVLVGRLVAAQVNFIYPPPFVATNNFSTNIVMVEGDFKVVQWANVTNPNNSRISVTMFQLNGTQFFGNPEYVIRMSPVLLISFIYMT